MAPESKVTNKKKYISYFARFAVAAGALYWTFRGEDLEKIGKLLTSIGPVIFIAAFAIYILSQIIFVLRWYLLLSVQGIKIGFPAAVKLHFIGLFYNNCLPSSIGGDLLRAWYVTKHTEKRLEAALSVFVDRVVGLAGIAIMAFVSYLFIPHHGNEQSFDLSSFNIIERIISYRWYFVGFFGFFILLILVTYSNRKGRVALNRSLSLIREHGRMIFDRTGKAFAVYYNKKMALLGALLLTFACQSIFIIGLWLVGRKIGAGVSFKYYLIFFPISWLIGALPVSIGGLGIMEWWLKTAFSQICGVPSTSASALAISQRLLWILASLPGAVIHLFGAHLPKDFFIDYKEPVN
ncbi:MAG: lysylphosphatidylglycerol synthase transmembrane domain-containing protein [Phycisphaerae bacterium]|nr:lysylphosphatidylglycerol synthase transmembrane domain-containing protein [Phycisphaerae bacterium]